MRLNDYFVLESIRTAEIKFWSSYFVLVDYLRKILNKARIKEYLEAWFVYLTTGHRGIDHSPLNEKSTYVGDELFEQFKRSANKDTTCIKFLDLKNQLKQEMQNIVTLLLGFSLRVQHDESRHRKVTKLSYLYFYGISNRLSTLFL